MTAWASRALSLSDATACRIRKGHHVFDWITGLVERGGYLAVAFLMFAEKAFSPIPSELIMPLAGFASARGDLNISIVILAGTLGHCLGQSSGTT
jgi:membrane protein DedA with SNARE-associated domain